MDEASRRLLARARSSRVELYRLLKLYYLKTTMPSPSQYAELERVLLNTSGDSPLASRFRALFSLRSLGTDEAIQIIGKGLHSPIQLSWTTQLK